MIHGIFIYRQLSIAYRSNINALSSSDVVKKEHRVILLMKTHTKNRMLIVLMGNIPLWGERNFTCFSVSLSHFQGLVILYALIFWNELYFWYICFSCLGPQFHGYCNLSCSYFVSLIHYVSVVFDLISLFWLFCKNGLYHVKFHIWP